MLDRTTQAPAADTLPLPAITRWMETKPPETPYIYTDPWVCPTALFLKEHGHHDVEIIPGLATFAGGSMTIPPEVDYVLSGAPHTYGAALDRARAMVQR